MFDPTVFDNLKVVIEGAIYDLDLHDDYQVMNRKDIIDLATMNREYEIVLNNSNLHPNLDGAAIKLLMDIENLSGELLNKQRFNPGCTIEISFLLTVNNVEKDCAEIEAIIQDVWGHERTIKQIITFNYSNRLIDKYHNEIQIHFNRLIGEEHVDDLLEMINYLCETLKKLDQWVNG